MVLSNKCQLGPLPSSLPSLFLFCLLFLSLHPPAPIYSLTYPTSQRITLSLSGHLPSSKVYLGTRHWAGCWSYKEYPIISPRAHSLLSAGLCHLLTRWRTHDKRSCVEHSYVTLDAEYQSPWWTPGNWPMWIWTCKAEGQSLDFSGFTSLIRPRGSPASLEDITLHFLLFWFPSYHFHIMW